MQQIIILIIIVLVVRYVLKKRAENKPVQVFGKGDPSQLPDTLAELRKMRDKSKSDEISYQCSRKICELGIQLYREGKLVVDPSSEYDVSTLLGEMYELINDSHTYVYIPSDDELEFRCLEAGTEMSEALNPPTPVDGGVFKFSDYAWPAYADFCAEGKVCPRNPNTARKYYRMRIVYESKIKNMYTGPIEGLMEVPLAGEDGRQEILKFIALMYGIGALKLKNGDIVRNCFAQTLQQAAELLFQMDWGRIGSEDISVMLDEYNKGADAGNAYAQYKLGNFYLKGRYVAKDEAKGLELLEKAAAQDLYLAVDALCNHYHWLAHPYAGDYGDASKEQIKAYTAAYNKWSSQSDRVLEMVEFKYANSFTDYISNSGNLSTRGPGKQTAPVSDAVYETDPQEQADMDSPFTILNLPDVITGPYNVTYRKISVSSNSADYYSDHGDSVTIHVGDIGMTGQSATNSSGYFYW